MAFSFEVEMPNYIIYRDTQPGRPFGAAPLVFIPSTDSDELFDALRAKFPLLKTHSERVGQATMEFLLEEAEQEKAQAQQQLSTPWMADVATVFPSGASSSQSTCSSPEMRSVPTSTFGDSPRPLSRQFSVATNTTAGSESSPPGMEGMTGVFSLPDATQTKQRHRRKMTEQEKIVYKARRIVKACDKCAKRKRKCTHNQQEMESVASKSQKIPRSSATSTAKKPPAPNLHVHIAEPEESLTTNPMGLVNPFDQMPSFEEFDELLNVPLLDHGLNHTFDPSQMEWPWAPTPDFTLMDTHSNSFTPGSQNAPAYQHDTSPTDSFLSNESNEIYDYDMMQFINANRQASPMIWEHLRTGQQPDSTQTSQSSRNSNAQSADRFSAGDMQQMKAPRYHDWKADDIHDSQRSLTEQHLQEVQTHLNERALGDNRRTTHSQTRQSLQNDGTSQVILDRELNASNNMEQTTTSDMHQLSSSSLDVSKKNSRNIHTGLNRAKRTTDGIDASIVIPDGPQEETQTHQENNATSQQQQQQRSLGELGDGIIANTSPTTEMFMLRRRIPKALHSIVDQDLANLRSRSAVSASTVPLAGTQLHGFIRVDINTSEIGIEARRSDGLDTRLDTDIADITDLPVQSATNQRLQVEAGQTLATEHTTRADDEVHSIQANVHEERLSDHFRRRDHFGRQFGAGLQVLSTIAGLGCLLMLLSLLPTQSSNLSMLLLALASASRGTKGAHRSYGYWSEMWGVYVPIIGKDKNKGWWARVNTQTSNFLRTREDTSSSTWVKETGMALDGAWWMCGSERAQCGHVGA